ncbi:NAD(P)-binding protein [Mytilinidion resinicola]|uniref:NAD(P)-binding protein n=1 Tax=Mytilinidion resinicola TaxID=574789 RepID=A0A6A6Z074_9PEZI|nr:NAD(P)-binding protein [Mytilinidion resinicola]KAF2814103.1 NAD(P)-binding protein [Mytilinidion resinicola]
MSLKNKIVLITGGGSGIGLCLVKQTQQLGGRIIIGDLKLGEEAQTLVSKDPNVIFQKCDVSKWKDLEALISASEKQWGDVPDAYGICAGVFDPPWSNFWQDPEDERYASVDINVNHPLKLTRFAIRASLGKGKKAGVCIIASIAGIAGNVASPLYCATKHAVVGFTKSMKGTDAYTGVRITTICPGLVKTPLFTLDKMKQFSFSDEKALLPEQVAEKMLDMLQKAEYTCGTVVELTPLGSRLIPEWNITPPVGKGTGQELEMTEEMKAMLAPIIAKLDIEKSAKL